MRTIVVSLFRWMSIVGFYALVAGVSLHAHAASARFGEVVQITGEVRAQNPDTGTVRTLVVGDVVFVGERIEAAETGEAVVRTDDAGVIAMRPKAIFYLQGFRADTVRESRFDLRIVRGALRLITGWVGVRNKANYRIQTPTATVGIRGTDQEPYVMSADMAQATGAKEGTYNKVNSGGVQMQSAAGSIELGRGQAGFVPSAPKGTTRGLMTALLPVLLDRVPAFYLPGRFDEGLERYAEQALSAALTTLPAEDGSVPPTTPAVPSATVAPPVSQPSTKTDTACPAETIGKRWLRDLDRALERRDAQGFIDLFAADVRVIARTRLDNGEIVETPLTRQELIQSTFSSLNQLSAFQSQRPHVGVRVLDGSACRRLEVNSTVVERGVSAGRSYQLESQELYELQWDKGVWRAKTAQTTQN